MNPLRWMFQFTFCGHHGHFSRVFTIKKRTYKVCLDCGEEFGLPEPYHKPLPSVADYDRARLKAITHPHVSII
jgi:hypothetical protein